MTPLRTSLSRAPKEPLTWDQLQPMCVTAWRQRGILVIRVTDLADDFDRQWATNVGNKLFGGRNGC